MSDPAPWPPGAVGPVGATWGPLTSATREDVAHELRVCCAEGGALRAALAGTLREELRDLFRVYGGGGAAPAPGAGRGDDTSKAPYLITVNGEAFPPQPVPVITVPDCRKRPPRLMTGRSSTSSWDDDLDNQARWVRQSKTPAAASAAPSHAVSHFNTAGSAASCAGDGVDGQAATHEWGHRHIKGYTVASEEAHLKLQKSNGRPSTHARRRKSRMNTPGLAELAAARFALGDKAPQPSAGRQGGRKGGDEVVVIEGRPAGGNSKSSVTNSEEDMVLEDSDDIPPYKPREQARPLGRQSTRVGGQPPTPNHASYIDLRSALTNESYSLREKLLVFVCSQWFDYMTGFLIITNAVTLGVQTDYLARNLGSTSLPIALRAIELSLCAFFTFEIILRLFVFRLDFFRMSGRAWNVFDMLLVFMQLVDELINFIVLRTASDSGESALVADLTVMRMFRLFRLVRIVRLVRVMRMIGELRTLVMSIAGSMKSLLWAVFLLFLIIYIVAVYITQLVSDYRSANLNTGVVVHEQLTYLYSDLGRTMLTLYQSVTGGVDWDIAVTPLSKEVSTFLGFVFTFYVAFILLAMMNVVTGVFTETAILSAKKDKDVYMVNHVRELFNNLDLDDSGMISWNQIESQLETTEIQEYFKAIDVDVSEAQALFKLLDLNDSGVISADDFLNGCIRIRGPARALETMLLLRETMRLADRQVAYASRMEQMLADIDNHILR